MLQKLKTWDFTSKFIVRQRRINPNDPRYGIKMKELGSWTRHKLVDLGPTFVKLGQLASTRKDLYCSEFIEELQTLQDQVPPIPEDDVVDILNHEVPELFMSIQTVPFKSASLGQVHKAILKNGTPVIIKLQRPNIQTIVESDINNIIQVLSILEFIGINTGNGSKQIFEEAKTYLFDELDYIKEAENAKLFYEMFYDVSWVRIPRVYSKILKKNILVMEYVEGTKITEITNQNKINVSKAIVRSFVTQIMTFGVFHGDPHPGNLAVNSEGQLVYYDFGLVIKLPENLRENITKLIPLIIQKNTRGIVNSLIDMNFIIPNTDKIEIILFIEASLKYMDGQTFNLDTVSDSLAREKPFQIPSDFIFLGKSFTTIDGICRQLDPNFNFIEYIEPMLEDELSINFGDLFTMYSDIPNKILTIDESVKDSELARINMKINADNNQREIRITQLIIILLVIFQNTHL